MHLNQKLIKDLREGRIVLENRPKDSDKVRAILNEAFPKQGYTEAYYNYYFVTQNNKEDYECTNARDYAQCRGTIVPIADFILPEPKFKIGDKVRHANNSNISGIVSDVEHNGHMWVYTIPPYSGVFKEEKLVRVYIGKITKKPETPCNPKPEYIIGLEYEFSQDKNHWKPGTLLGIIDHHFKYVAVRPDRNDGNPLTFRYIRHIQPKEVTKDTLVDLLTGWYRLSEHLSAGAWHETFANLTMNTGSVLEQLKHQS